VRTERPRVDSQSLFAQQAHKEFIKWNGFFGARGLGKRWASPLAAIAVQRELAYGQYSAGDVVHGQVELAVGVFKTAQVKYLVGHLNRVPIGIAGVNAKKDHQPAGDLSHHGAVYRNGGVIRALDHGPHNIGFLN